MDPFIDYPTAAALAETHGTPLYVYHEATLREQARAARAFPAPFGLTVRYAIKAAPNRFLLRLFEEEGLHFDASSGYEAHRILRAGIPGEKISLSAQELPGDLDQLVRAGVALNACSLSQLEAYGRAFPGTRVGLRFNPGLGSGATNRTNVGGVASSFGIWHAYREQARRIVEAHQLQVHRIHTHIGSGSDPGIWERAAALSLEQVRAFPSVQIFNMGGGYKVARMPGESATDLQAIGQPVAALLRQIAADSGRQLHMEIEPGTFLTANAGAILARVQDVVDTGPEGFTFLKLDCGMTEILRPSLYGSQHPIHLLQLSPASESQPAIVVGHCCESGDILTPAPGDPEGLQPRILPKSTCGDFVVVGGAGAYCSAMAATHYNAFPQAPEVLLRMDGTILEIRRRQTLGQILENEWVPES